MEIPLPLGGIVLRSWTPLTPHPSTLLYCHSLYELPLYQQ
uniref:Uncharacterized protein n=1 Tax=Anguilla anguilla TaxID=7936 RepID=A0A0E9QZT2_ANGAN